MSSSFLQERLKSVSLHNQFYDDDDDDAVDKEGDNHSYKDDDHEQDRQRRSVSEVTHIYTDNEAEDEGSDVRGSSPSQHTNQNNKNNSQGREQSSNDSIFAHDRLRRPFASFSYNHKNHNNDSDDHKRKRTTQDSVNSISIRHRSTSTLEEGDEHSPLPKAPPRSPTATTTSAKKSNSSNTNRHSPFALHSQAQLQQLRSTPAVRLSELPPSSGKYLRLHPVTLPLDSSPNGSRGTPEPPPQQQEQRLQQLSAAPVGTSLAEVIEREGHEAIATEALYWRRQCAKLERQLARLQEPQQAQQAAEARHRGLHRHHAICPVEEDSNTYTVTTTPNRPYTATGAPATLRDGRGATAAAPGGEAAAISGEDNAPSPPPAAAPQRPQEEATESRDGSSASTRVGQQQQQRGRTPSARGRSATLDSLSPYSPDQASFVAQEAQQQERSQGRRSAIEAAAMEGDAASQQAQDEEEGQQGEAHHRARAASFLMGKDPATTSTTYFHSFPHTKQPPREEAEGERDEGEQTGAAPDAVSQALFAAEDAGSDDKNDDLAYHPEGWQAQQVAAATTAAQLLQLQLEREKVQTLQAAVRNLEERLAVSEEGRERRGKEVALKQLVCEDLETQLLSKEEQLFLLQHQQASEKEEGATAQDAASVLAAVKALLQQGAAANNPLEEEGEAAQQLRALARTLQGRPTEEEVPAPVENVSKAEETAPTRAPSAAAHLDRAEVEACFTALFSLFDPATRPALGPTPTEPAAALRQLQEQLAAAIEGSVADAETSQLQLAEVREELAVVRADRNDMIGQQSEQVRRLQEQLRRQEEAHAAVLAQLADREETLAQHRGEVAARQVAEERVRELEGVVATLVAQQQQRQRSTGGSVSPLSPEKEEENNAHGRSLSREASPQPTLTPSLQLPTTVGGRNSSSRLQPTPTPPRAGGGSLLYYDEEEDLIAAEGRRGASAVAPSKPRPSPDAPASTPASAAPRPEHTPTARPTRPREGSSGGYLANSYMSQWASPSPPSRHSPSQPLRERSASQGNSMHTPAGGRKKSPRPVAAGGDGYVVYPTTNNSNNNNNSSGGGSSASLTSLRAEGATEPLRRRRSQSSKLGGRDVMEQHLRTWKEQEEALLLSTPPS